MAINRDFGILTYVEARPVAVLWFDTEGAHIVQLYRILNPEKLTGVPDLAVHAETLAANGQVISGQARGLS
jgi:hypothetical protein